MVSRPTRSLEDDIQVVEAQDGRLNCDVRSEPIRAHITVTDTVPVYVISGVSAAWRRVAADTTFGLEQWKSLLDHSRV